MIRILTFSSLYPNARQPGRGIFVEARLRKLIAAGGVEASVMAPVPWFPFTHPRFGEYAEFASAPASECRHDIYVRHSRYPTIPKIGMSVAPYLMALAILPSIRRLVRTERIDLIDAHYFYPDGVAATIVARLLRLPVVITARGTDISLIPQYALPRRLIRWAGKRCDAMISVCQALKDEMVEIGLDANKISVLRNGVDLDFFKLTDVAESKVRTGLTTPTLLSVGYLIERKRHDLVISAMPHLPEHTLVVIGDGPEKNSLVALAASLGVADRVIFAGQKSQSELSDYYSAADALVLMSDREGMANVLLESMACGTPVVARNLWGTPEVVSSDVAGRLVEQTSPQHIATAIRGLVNDKRVSKEAVRRHAEQYSWDATSEGQMKVFRSILSGKSQQLTSDGGS